MRKVDWRLLPPLTVLYVLSFMDRSNIGNTKVAGMNVDLGLTGPQFNMVLTVFLFPYAMFEVPSNIVLYRTPRLASSQLGPINWPLSIKYPWISQCPKWTPQIHLSDNLFALAMILRQACVGPNTSTTGKSFSKTRFLLRLKTVG